MEDVGDREMSVEDVGEGEELMEDVVGDREGSIEDVEGEEKEVEESRAEKWGTEEEEKNPRAADCLIFFVESIQTDSKTIANSSWDQKKVTMHAIYLFNTMCMYPIDLNFIHSMHWLKSQFSRLGLKSLKTDPPEYHVRVLIKVRNVSEVYVVYVPNVSYNVHCHCAIFFQNILTSSNKLSGYYGVWKLLRDKYK